MRIRNAFIGSLAMLAMAHSANTMACESNPQIGSICVMAANFCPRGFAQADGQLLAISSNSALFSLIGTTYGGDGRTTFALPDLRGRAMVGFGTGPGLSPLQWGDRGGNESVTLTQAQLPSHTHDGHINATDAVGDVDNPSGAIPARMPRSRIYSSGASNAQTAAGSVTVTGGGGGAAVPVRDPYLGIRVCIALQGIFPSRN